MKINITQEQLKTILDYDPATGVFTWKIHKGRTYPGDKAGSINSIGYWQIMINQVNYLAHRLVYLWLDGYWPENQIDHINRIRSDNRRENLREVSQSCNNINSNVRCDNKTKVTGVSWSTRDKAWISRITVNKK